MHADYAIPNLNGDGLLVIHALNTGLSITAWPTHDALLAQLANSNAFLDLLQCLGLAFF
jgi:hypothetical protein